MKLTVDWGQWGGAKTFPWHPSCSSAFCNNIKSGGEGGFRIRTGVHFELHASSGAKTFPEAVVLEGSLCLIHCQNHIKSNSRSNPSVLTHRLVLYLISITLLNPFIWLIWLTSHDRHMMDTRWTHDRHYDGHYDGHYKNTLLGRMRLKKVWSW